MFPILSFDQANPILTGASRMADLIRQRQSNQYMATQNEYLPQNLQAKLQSEQLKNALAQNQLNYAPQTSQAELALKQAQLPYIQAQTNMTNTYAQNPLLKQGGVAGQLASLMYLKQHPELAGNLMGDGNPPAQGAPGDQGGQPGQPSALGGENDLGKILMANINKQLAQTNSLNTRTSALPYTSLPPDQRNYSIAQATAFGYDPLEASGLLLGGKTLKDLGEAKGYSDPNNYPDPVYAPTATTRSQVQRRNQSLAELDSLGKTLNEAVEPYERRFNGYSLPQIADAIKGENPDTQAKFLAAKFLMPEYNSLRLKVMNGQVGIEALREVGSASMNNFKAIQSLVDPKVYKQANEYVDKWLNQAVDKANKSVLRPSSYKTNAGSEENKPNLPAPPPGTVHIVDPDGVYHNIPKMNLQEAIKRGAKEVK